MNDKLISILLMACLIVGLIIYVYFSEKKEKELEEKYELERIEKERKRKIEETKERKKNSIVWNNEVQKDFDGKVKYSTNKHHIVLIGDYTCVAKLTNSTLKSMGFETEVVPTASDVIDRIKSDNKYDLIITNNVYPNGESGDTILTELKENEHIDTPIVILTVDQNARKRYLDKGYDDYIPKPLTEEQVKEVFPKVIKGLKFTKIKSNKTK